MEEIISNTMSESEIQRFKVAYERALNQTLDHPDSTRESTKFHYAFALTKSKNKSEIKEGVNMLVELYEDATSNNERRREYLYCIAVGQTRLKEYAIALECIEQFLQVEPENHQAIELRKFIKERLSKDGLLGMGIAGLALAAAIGIGFALSKKS